MFHIKHICQTTLIPAKAFRLDVTQVSGTDVSEFDVGGERRDDLFDALSNQRRRVLLHSLQVENTPVSVEELTTKLVAWETQRPASDRSGDDREAIEISLVHNHLPKMADAELIEYDATRRSVLLANRTDELQAHLRTMASS